MSTIKEIIECRRAEREKEAKAQIESERRRQTISDVEQNSGSLREWKDRARKEAAAADAKSREENQRRGTQFERSEHLTPGSPGGIVDSRAGAGRRAKEEREERLRNGEIPSGRPPWA